MSDNQITLPAVTAYEAGVRFWDTRYDESPSWSEVRLNDGVMVSFKGQPWKPIEDCEPDERAVVIAVDALYNSMPLLDGLPEAISGWTDEEVSERLHVPVANVPWMRESRGRFWSVQSAFALQAELGLTSGDFFARVYPTGS
ncbi:hypothetical protein [Microbacterium lacus]|uniref:Uncharacterized protein n=1 Tax=Microbacterium lacus TaxID=415217 RepID=A0ABN2GWR4_9MICO